MRMLGTVRILTSEQHIGYYLEEWEVALFRAFSARMRVSLKKVKPRNKILIVGGNDVRRATSPEELAANLESLVSVLHYRFEVSQIHVCKLLPRLKQCFDYNSTVDRAIILLKTSLQRFEFASFWEHNDSFPLPKVKACDHKFLVYGVQLNKQGNVHLDRSLRGLFCLECVEVSGNYFLHIYPSLI